MEWKSEVPWHQYVHKPPTEPMGICGVSSHQWAAFADHLQIDFHREPTLAPF